MTTRTGRVTGRQTGTNKDGADSVRLLQVMITDRDDVQTVQLVSQAGEESNPPDGSAVVLLSAGSALKLAIATLDRVVPDLAVGGKRIYSTAADGVTVMAEARLDPDGKITIHNDLASQTIHPDGTVEIINPLASINMAPDGAITASNGAASITLDAAGVISFHGTQAVFDCPVTAPSVALVTTGGGTGGITAAGDIDATGTITGTADVIAGTISGKTHVHSGVTSGPNNSGGPL
jgi:phage gp45-like